MADHNITVLDDGIEVIESVEEVAILETNIWPVPTPAPGGPGGNGDMLKSTYDPDDDGKVVSAAAADSVPWEGVQGRPVNTDGLVEGLNNLYYTATRAQNVAAQAVLAHEAKSNAHTPESVGAQPAHPALDSLTGLTSAGFVVGLGGNAYQARLLIPSDIPDLTATYATTAQGNLAATALQPGDSIPQGDVTNLAATLAAKADLVGGKIPTSQIPAIAIGEFLGEPANEAAMLALSGQNNDWVIRTDRGTKWVLITVGGSQLSDWVETPTATDVVTGVNGQTGGNITLGAADVGAETSAQLNLRDEANRNLGNATGLLPQAKVDGLPAALAGKEPTIPTGLINQYITGAKTLALLNRAAVGLSNVDNTADSQKPISTLQQQAFDDKQPLNSTLSAISSSATTFGISLVSAADSAAARQALGIQPHAIGQACEFHVPIALVDGLWTDDRGWRWLPLMGQTIGGAGSGADTANAVLERVFKALWPHVSLATPGYALFDAVGAAASPGASAQADWDAGHRLLLPDHRGRVAIPPGQGAGLSDRAVGATGGEEEHANTPDENGPHGHTGTVGFGGTHGHSSPQAPSQRTSNEAGGYGIPFGTGGFIDRAMVWVAGVLGISVAPNHNHTVTINSSGTGDPHNTMQPFVVVEKLIFTGELA